MTMMMFNVKFVASFWQMFSPSKVVCVYCMCFYDIGLWSKYSVTVFKRMEACYNKCIKSFFKYRRLDSVTDMLSELGLPSFRTLFNQRWLTSVNGAVRHFIRSCTFSFLVCH